MAYLSAKLGDRAAEYDQDLAALEHRLRREFDAWSEFCARFGIEQRAGIEISFGYRRLIALLGEARLPD